MQYCTTCNMYLLFYIALLYKLRVLTELFRGQWRRQWFLRMQLHVETTTCHTSHLRTTQGCKINSIHCDVNREIGWQFQFAKPQAKQHWHLTHWGRVTHICVGNLTIIGSDNRLSPGQHQAIIWTNAGILLIGPSGTNFSEILAEIITFSIIFHSRKCISKCRLRNGGHFVSASMC